MGSGKTAQGEQDNTMKRTALIIAALLIAITAQALPRHILITVNEATWCDSNKQKQVHKTAEKYITAPSIFGHGTGGYTNAAGDVYGVTLHWAQHWTKKADKLDNGNKHRAVNRKLSKAGVTMIPCATLEKGLAEAGLTAIYEPPCGTNSTTATVSATTTTTTTRRPFDAIRVTR